MELPIVNLTSEELIAINHKIIAEGSEGVLYAAPGKKLYKIYKKPIEKVAEFEKDLKEALLRQENVHLTSLPEGMVLVDDYPAGCILNRFICHENIDKMNYYRKEAQYKILKGLILRVKELVENQIYPLDLNNQNLLYEEKGNVLVSKTGKVEIIDLDRSSAAYTPNRLRHYENFVYSSLGELIHRQLSRSRLSGPKELMKRHELLTRILFSSLHAEQLPKIEEIVDLVYAKK